MPQKRLRIKFQNIIKCCVINALSCYSFSIVFYSGQHVTSIVMHTNMNPTLFYVLETQQ